MLGYERSLLLAKPFFTRVAKPVCAAFLHHLRECRDRQTEIISEVALRDRPGRNCPSRVNAERVPVLDARRGNNTVLSHGHHRYHRAAAQAERPCAKAESAIVIWSSILPDGIFHSP